MASGCPAESALCSCPAGCGLGGPSGGQSGEVEIASRHEKSLEHTQRPLSELSCNDDETQCCFRPRHLRSRLRGTLSRMRLERTREGVEILSNLLIFRRGDIITSIAGVIPYKVDVFLALPEHLAGRSSVDVDFRRAGRPHSVRFKVSEECEPQRINTAYTVSQLQIEAWRADQKSERRAARIVRIDDNSYRVYGIRGRSTARALGLRNGDTVKEFAGQPVSCTSEGECDDVVDLAFARLVENGPVSIIVERKGVLTELRVEKARSPDTKGPGAGELAPNVVDPARLPP